MLYPTLKSALIFVMVEKLKTGISSIFSYVVAQLNKAWHLEDIIKT